MERNPADSISSCDDLQTHWIQAQEILKTRVITEDDFPTEANDVALRYVGGVDVSYPKDDTSLACAALVVMDIEESFEVVYDDYSVVRVTVPYVPAFLAFREAPILLQLLDKMKMRAHSFYPQLLMVDGNGLLHPRGFGLACHLGVLANLPTIGVGKNLHHVDGLTQSRVRQLLEAEGSFDKEIVTLIGDSGRTWGAAVRSTQGSSKPIFISTGHRVSLDTAVKIAKLTCKYRIPEPIRQATPQHTVLHVYCQCLPFKSLRDSIGEGRDMRKLPLLILLFKSLTEKATQFFGPPLTRTGWHAIEELRAAPVCDVWGNEFGADIRSRVYLQKHQGGH